MRTMWKEMGREKSSLSGVTRERLTRFEQIERGGSLVQVEDMFWIPIDRRRPRPIEWNATVSRYGRGMSICPRRMSDKR